MSTREISVEQHLKQFPALIRTIANRLRKLVKQAAPNSIERFYPGWKLIGYRAVSGNKSHYFGFIYPTPDNVVLGFEYGTMLSDPQGVLEGSGTQVRSVTIRSQRDVQTAILTPLICEAVSIAVERKLQTTRKGKK